MSTIAPSPSASRGEVVLQPTYFTSSIFVNALRDDISALTAEFDDQYPSPQPFSTFKHIWSSQGWPWLHFMVLDNRTRQAFLNTVLRLFMEHTLGPGSLPSKAAAFFAFYTFFYTQVHDTAPPLYAIEHAPIPLDHYMSLKRLPDSFESEALLPLKSLVCYILSVLLKNQIFFIVPHSVLGPLNPRTLPREIFIDGHHLLPTVLNAPKKKGRPSKRDKAKKAKTALEDLDGWLDRAANTPATDVSLQIDHSHFAAAYPTTMSLARYQTEKSSLLNSIGADILSGSMQTQLTVERANRFILERLKSANQLDSLRGLPFPSEGEELVGISRVERALEELACPTGSKWGVGALGLLEGAGMTR